MKLIFTLLSLGILTTSCGIKYSYIENTRTNKIDMNTLIYNDSLHIGVETYSAKVISLNKNKTSKQNLLKFKLFKELYPNKLNLLYSSTSTGMFEDISEIAFINNCKHEISPINDLNSIWSSSNKDSIEYYYRIQKRKKTVLVENYIPVEIDKCLEVHRSMTENTYQRIKDRNINFINIIN